MAVIDNAFETKKTELWFLNPPSTIIKLTCPTGITGVNGGTKDKIDTTCLDLDSPFRSYIGGFADASEVTVPFILYDGDASQADLFSLQQSGVVTGWYVGLSDSAAAPTGPDSDGMLTSPTGRTGFSFLGYVSNLTFDMAINEVVRGTLTIQATGFTQFHAAV